MPKKKTIPPPDDFSSEFMENESGKELSEQQVEAAGSDYTEAPLAEPPEVDLGSSDVSGTADVEENEPDSGPVPYGAKYKPFMERMNSILATMLTAEIDFIVRGLDNTARSVVASRKAAMLRKRQTFYLDANEEGIPMIYEGRVVQARVIGVAEKVLRVEVFGVECTIFARDLSAAWFGDAREYYSVGDRVLVRVLTIDRGDINHISITADIRSVSSAANQSKLDKCVLQGKYAGRVTDVRHGVVFIRLNNGVNAVAHTCYDRRMPGKKDDVSFAVTRLDEERGIAVGIITRIIKQNL